MRCKKGQVSTELMIIIGVILVVFIPLIVAMYFKTSEINNSLQTSQAQLAVGRMANIANSMGNLGKGSYMRMEVYLPQNVQSIYFNKFDSGGGEVVFVVRDSSGATSDVVESTHYPIAGPKIDNPTSGLATFEITSDGTNVNVNKA